MSKPTEQMENPVTMLSLEQIQQSRVQFVNHAANAQTTALLLMDQLTNDHGIMMAEIKKLQGTITTQNTQLQVADVEITKYKEQLSKSSVAKETPPPIIPTA